MATTPSWFQNPEMIRALLGAAGSGLETLSQYQQSKANREQQQQLGRAATLQSLYEGDQSEDMLRERTALDATQLNPFRQLEADQAQAIRAALLGDITNVTGSFDPSSGTGRLSGGINLANLQRPDVQGFFSPEARLGAREQFDMTRTAVSPNVPMTGGAYAGYGPAGAGAAGRVSGFGQQRFADLASRRDTERDAIMRALEGDIQGQQKKSGGGFWSKLGGVLKFAAPIAAMAIPGLGPVASMALAGGGSAAGTALQGGGLTDSLLAGGMGAAGAKFGPKIRIPGTTPAPVATPPFNPSAPNAGGQNPFNRVRLGGR